MKILTHVSKINACTTRESKHGVVVGSRKDKAELRIKDPIRRRMLQDKFVSELNQLCQWAAMWAGGESPTTTAGKKKRKTQGFWARMGSKTKNMVKGAVFLGLGLQITNCKKLGKSEQEWADLKTRKSAKEKKAMKWDAGCCERQSLSTGMMFSCKAQEILKQDGGYEKLSQCLTTFKTLYGEPDGVARAALKAQPLIKTASVAAGLFVGGSFLAGAASTDGEGTGWLISSVSMGVLGVLAGGRAPCGFDARAMGVLAGGRGRWPLTCMLQMNAAPTCCNCM